MAAKGIGLKTALFSLTAVGVLEVAARALGTMWGLGVIRCLDVAALLVIARLYENGPVSLGLGRKNLSSGVRHGLVWSAAFGAVTALMFALLFMAGLNPLDFFRMRFPGGGLLIFQFLLVGGVIGPIAEEMFFRGVAFGFFRRWGLIAGLTASTAVFVLAHNPAKISIWTQAVGGLVFSLAYEKSGSLAAPIIIHILGNLAIFALGLGLAKGLLLFLFLQPAAG